jgi:ParB family chromosome partitioning protein
MEHMFDRQKKGRVVMLVDADKIIMKDRIRKDFGDLEELAKDIQENGLINPPVVTPDNVLIAGERRFRAMTQILGWKQIEVRPMTVQDALHQLKLEISENENRKDFTFSEKMDWAERLKEEYRKIAEANQKAGTSVTHVTQVGRVDKRVAEEVGLGSHEKLRKAEYIKANADEEMIRQLDEGQLSINAAYVKLKKKAEEAEAKLKEVEKERDILAQEAVEATRAVKAATDSEEYLRMRESLEKEKEKARKYYEDLQAVKKGACSPNEIKEAVNKAIEATKKEYKKLIDQLQKEVEEARETAAMPEPEVIEVVPDDYEELKRAKAELDAIKNSSDPDISKQILRIHTDDRTPEQKLNNYEKRAIDEVGGFLSILRGLEVQFDLCNKLPVTTKRLLRTNITEIQQILAKMDNAIMEGNEECKTA